MFFAGYFIRSPTPLPKPLFTILHIFSLPPPPPSFPFIRSSFAAITNFFRDALAIIQFLWPLFVLVFCISLFTCFVQQYIFAFLSWAVQKLAYLARRVLLPLWKILATAVDPIIKKLPSNWNPFGSKKQSGGKSRSGGKK
ncbi:hypothetical protein MKX07_001369 [Trichoderma sp. CBMAI-0711]|uniref:Uncharacterized protein n=1 Tax=Trichoderma parareesei TaxID=858221 RepID=A0A2H2ZL39_TRIPA|nr:hypothetical protein MKX07_001369 [Trichoderma sp. CBMAI-0711]OTA00761.1 hypothetical protein A9Z42_0010200 [Trichoderma parareesei]